MIDFGKGKKIALRWITSLIDLRRLAGIIAFPEYIIDFIKYRGLSKAEKVRIFDAYPCLIDKRMTTPFDPHYFYQACWLARCLSDLKPSVHIDIGSQVQMIGVLSGFVKIKFIDYRPLRVNINNLECLSGSITALFFPSDNVESLSCLHVMEHIGLGRYGDPLDPYGSKKAADELMRVLKPNGHLFLSVPIGTSRVCFNAHRVFSSQAILTLFDKLKLIEFSYVDDSGHYHQNQPCPPAIDMEYGCGMFVFKK